MIVNPFRFGDQYREAVMADNPLMYLRLNEPAGTRAADTSGNNRNGTYTGGYTLDQTPVINYNRSLLLNGTTGYVAVPISGLNLSRNFTIEAWVKTQSGGPTNQSLISTGIGGYYMRLGLTGTRLEFIRSQTALIGNGPTDIAIGDVVHAAITVDGSGNWVIYKNAVSVATGTTAVSFSGGSPNLLVGVDYNTLPNTEFLKGFIDEVAVYGSALTSTRLLAHYTAGTT